VKRPFALPPGITRTQARAAAIAICGRAADRGEAEELLRCAGIIPDPGVTGAHLADPACHPLGGRTTVGIQ
jgi:hypothetical protein